jgi:dGTP triphosphohydrolase
VIPLSKIDFVHTRLTLEVSVVGRSLGRLVGKIIEKCIEGSFIYDDYCSCGFWRMISGTLLDIQVKNERNFSIEMEKSTCARV